MKFNIKTRIIKTGLIALMALGLTGCSGVTLDQVLQYTDRGDMAFDAIKERNLAYIQDLNDAGFLSDSQAKDWTDSVIAKMAAIESQFGSGGSSNNDAEKITKQVLSAITKDSEKEAEEVKNIYFDKDGKLYGKDAYVIKCSRSGCDNKVEFEKNAIYTKASCTETYIDSDGEEHTCGGTIYEKIDTSNYDTVLENPQNWGAKGKAFELYDATQAQQLKEALGRPIHIISKFEGDNTPEKLQIILAILNEDRTSAQALMDEYSLGSVYIGRNTIQALVSNIGSLSTDIKAEIEKSLLAYCVPAQDSNGNTITYLNVNTYDGQKRVDDAGNPYIFADSWASESSPTDANEDNKVGTYIGGKEDINKLGKDLILTSDKRIIMRIRIMEFNPELISTIYKNQDSNTGIQGKYYLTQFVGKNDLVAVKLDYPLYKIDSIQTSDTSSKNWWCTIADTSLKMDLSDGNLYDDEGYKLKYGGDFNLYNNASTAFWYSDQVDPNKSDSNKIEMVIKQGANGNDIKVKVRPLVLKDYVELYAIKDSDGNGLYESAPADKQEYWAALGRRMRVKKFKGGADDINEFAQSLNIDGSINSNPNFISLDKIADKTSGYGFYEDVAEKLALGLSNDTVIQNAIDSGDRSGRLKESTGLTADNTGGLGFSMAAYFNYINPTICLGTELKEDGDRIKEAPLAQLDHSKVYKKSTGGTYLAPTIYGMCIGESLYDMNMTGGDWINGSEDQCINIIKWNTWLSENNFSYSIPIKKLLEILNLVTEMLEDSKQAITIDKEVIEIILRDKKEDMDASILMTLRTWSRIFGFVISAYALLLMGAWTIDVNIYGGPKFLTIMTGGKWVAVRDADDYPEIGDKSKYYIDLRRLIMSVCAIMAIGCMLTFIDFYDLRRTVQKYSGAFAETVRKLLIE